MTSPVRRQYLQIKRQYPDAILFFRLGDFYETFDDDARTVSRELDIVLTSRDVGTSQRVPLAGVPYHAAEGYIARLINKGYKVAICEQVGEPVKGLMPRQVVRVVTPGTVVEASLLDERRNNYLVALVLDERDQRAGLAYADITTGDFAATQWAGSDAQTQVNQELQRLQPRECLVPADPHPQPLSMPGRGESAPSPHRGDTLTGAGGRGEGRFPLPDQTHLTPYDPWRFELETARRALLDHFGVATLEGFGIASWPAAIRAAGALIQYLQETQPAALKQLTHLHAYSTAAFMTLDPATRRNLELNETTRGRTTKGSLLWVLDATETAMGGRLLRQWLNQPLLDLEALVARQDAVAALHANVPLRAQVRAALHKVADMERLAGRAVQGVAGPRDLLALCASLEQVPALRSAVEQSAYAGDNSQRSALSGQPSAVSSRLSALISALDPAPDVVALIAQAIAADAPATPGEGTIRPGFSAELDEVRALARGDRDWVARLERTERERTGIKSLKVGYNKVFGYYLEVTRPNLDQVPPHYIRKQTLVNAERFITPELKEVEARILNAEERMGELETALYRQVLQQVAAASDRLTATARALAELDVYAALAEVAERNRYVRPVLTAGDEIHIVAGRHPVVELTAGEPFVPNDVRLSNTDCQIIVLTGPNMSGKSTFLRQVALICLMAQIGSFVPADSATIGLVDRIFTRVGAQDDIATGQSTFMVEMVETALILQHASPRSLIILDEIGRGTSTYDGVAIARAVVEYLHNNPRVAAKTLFATHYHELTELASILPRVRNFNVAVLEEGREVVFLRRVVPGGADRSYGIHVARMAGVPQAVTHRAEEVLAELESLGDEKRRREAMGRQLRAQQLSFLPTEPHPVVETLRKLRIEELSPLEAITRLYELQRQVREDSS